MGTTEQHQRRSIRLKEFDYASAGASFVTLVTHDRDCLFGEIKADDMVLNPVGEMIRQEWKRLSSRFSEVELDEFVIMPNHVHGIIMIKEQGTVPTSLQEGAAPGLKDSDVARTSLLSEGAAPRLVDSDPERALLLSEGAAPGLFISDPGRTSLRPYGAAAVVVAGSLGAIVRAFKSAAALRFNRMRCATGKPLWQRNYYEHIVRDEKDLLRIRQYIRDNPLRWALDEDNPSARRGAAGREDLYFSPILAAPFEAAKGKA